jgi:hypothetical protein
MTPTNGVKQGRNQERPDALPTRDRGVRASKPQRDPRPWHGRGQGFESPKLHRRSEALSRSGKGLFCLTREAHGRWVGTR